eukprot:2563759-Amphidinium_carterae.3
MDCVFPHCDVLWIMALVSVMYQPEKIAVSRRSLKSSHGPAMSALSVTILTLWGDSRAARCMPIDVVGDLVCCRGATVHLA